MKAAFVVALCTGALLIGCGGGREESAGRISSATSAVQPAGATSTLDVRAALPRMARELIPDSALRSVAPGELKIEECGISPTFPCTHVFFALEEGRGLEPRVRSLRALAESNGWRIDGVERFRTGAYLDLVQEPFQARYTIGSGLTGPEVSDVQLAVYGPPTKLARPSPAQRDGWSNEKRQYVQAANAVCSRTLGRLSDPDDLAPVLAEAAKELSALEPPPGEEAEVQSVLRPLRTLAKAARALADEEGEDALPAAVGVGEFGKRFIEAASRYGLDKCVLA
jgi:hypothetical protein